MSLGQGQSPLSPLSSHRGQGLVPVGQQCRVREGPGLCVVAGSSLSLSLCLLAVGISIRTAPAWGLSPAARL